MECYSPNKLLYIIRLPIKEFLKFFIEFSKFSKYKFQLIIQNKEKSSDDNKLSRIILIIERYCHLP
jgi:hypothetical protein